MKRESTKTLNSTLPPPCEPQDVERVLEFEFVRATENAALNAIHWLGRGEKEKGDAAACDAIYGVFDRVDIRGEVVIGEGIKDNAPGIFVGEKLGTWKDGSPRFDIALDPIDGTTNLSKGLPNSISVIAAAMVPERRRTSCGTFPATIVTRLPMARRWRWRCSARAGPVWSMCRCPRCS